MLKERKTEECQKKLQQLDWKKRGKVEDNVKRWTDEFEGDLNMTRITNRQEMAKDRREWREIVLRDKVHSGL